MKQTNERQPASPLLHSTTIPSSTTNSAIASGTPTTEERKVYARAAVCFEADG